MMGVPAVTLRWPTLVGRISAAIQTCVGIPDWCADTADDYIKLAVRKAADMEGIAKLRPKLRGMFLASPIGNRKVYVGAVEARYREVWRRWCAKKVLDTQRIAA